MWRKKTVASDISKIMMTFIWAKTNLYKKTKINNNKKKICDL